MKLTPGVGLQNVIVGMPAPSTHTCRNLKGFAASCNMRLSHTSGEYLLSLGEEEETSKWAQRSSSRRPVAGVTLSGCGRWWWECVRRQLTEESITTYCLPA